MCGAWQSRQCWGEINADLCNELYEKSIKYLGQLRKHHQRHFIDPINQLWRIAMTNIVSVKENIQLVSCNNFIEREKLSSISNACCTCLLWLALPIVWSVRDAKWMERHRKLKVSFNSFLVSLPTLSEVSMPLLENFRTLCVSLFVFKFILFNLSACVLVVSKSHGIRH